MYNHLKFDFFQKSAFFTSCDSKVEIIFICEYQENCNTTTYEYYTMIAESYTLFSLIEDLEFKIVDPKTETSKRNKISYLAKLFKIKKTRMSY